MLVLVPRPSRISVRFSARPLRAAQARTLIWTLVLAGIALGAVPLAAQTPPPAGDGGLPVNVAGELLDDAFAQTVGSSQSVMLRRSRNGKVAVIIVLALLLVGVRLLYGAGERSGREGENDGAGVEVAVEPPSISGGECQARPERRSRPGDGGRRPYRPYRSRAEEPSTPLALPPHVLAILARSNASEGPVVEKEAAPYHAPDSPVKPPSVDEPPEQRLDLVIPAFTPWRKKK